MKLDMILQIPDHVLAREVSGETVVLDLESGMYFGLNEVGSRVWNLLEQGLSLASVCDRIEAEFAAPREAIENDVLELCNSLAQNKLVTLAT